MNHGDPEAAWDYGAEVPSDGGTLVEIMQRAVAAVRGALAGLDSWGPAGTRPGQYRSDIAADAAAVGVLRDGGLAVMSEESGWVVPRSAERSLVAVVDPLDGSTNAARGIPWFATSICILDDTGPRAAVVTNLVSGTGYVAVRGEGAFRDGSPIAPSGENRLDHAVVGLSGFPDRNLGWSQFRSLGAAALDLCAVADGRLDAYAVVGRSRLGPWDYLGGMLVCTEAGAVVRGLGYPGRGEDEIVTDDPRARRALAAGATPALLDELVTSVRKGRGDGDPTGAVGLPGDRRE